MIKELERSLNVMEEELHTLQAREARSAAENLRIAQLKRERAELLDTCVELPPEDEVYLARHASRPGVVDYVHALFTDFFEQKGDRHSKEDGSIYGGIALYKGDPVTVIGHRKGKNLSENIDCNFGMPSPEGYRKAQRLMEQAEKFHRPVITFIDTPGAYPGLEAEAGGQGEAIARSLALMSRLTVPTVAIVTGEGGSGGALALAVSNRVLMLEHAVYSILSPEGFASILWKDSARSAEAAALMKLTARDLKALGVVDEVIPEPPGGAHRNPNAVFVAVDRALTRHLNEVRKAGSCAVRRQKKFRAMGTSEVSLK
jgi:acetyl-CoA carboxylase carboxyl transferase subunit alpha